MLRLGKNEIDNIVKLLMDTHILDRKEIINMFKDMYSKDQIERIYRRYVYLIENTK